MNDKITQINPFKRINDLERKIFKDSFFSNFPSLWSDEWKETASPSSELVENENSYYLTAEIPGMNKEDIKIEASDRHLRVYGERKEEHERENTRHHYSEISYGSFSREYNFPEKISESGIEASYRNGLLRIRIPKSAKSRLQKIEVK